MMCFGVRWEVCCSRSWSSSDVFEERLPGCVCLSQDVINELFVYYCYVFLECP